MISPGAIAFTLFGLDIRWYGILIAMGAAIGLYICCHRAPKHGLKSDDILDITLWSLPLGIVGARLYYVVFEWEFYQNDLSSIFNIRNGGLAIHGGLLFGLITAYIVCRKKNISFLEVSDLFFPAIALAQSIGRWGNFFNNEAYGTSTNLPWAIIVNGNHVHPTFLYESVWCLFIFLILLYIDNRRTFRGQTTCLYGMLYAPERFLVESLRTDSLMIGPFRQAQVISVFIFVLCFLLYFYFRKKTQKN